MKHITTKNFFAFIITVMMFSFMPALVNAQRCDYWRPCPKAYRCLNGICVKKNVGNRHGTTSANIYYSGSQPATISFSLDQAERLSVKIFNMNGRLMKTLADKIFEQGEHQLQWDADGVNAGIYIVQFSTGAYRETKKITVIK